MRRKANGSMERPDTSPEARTADVARVKISEGEEDRTGVRERQGGDDKAPENNNGGRNNGRHNNVEAAGMGFAGRTVGVGRRSGSLEERVCEMESRRGRARRASGYGDG